MPHRMLTLEELTAYLHLAKGDVERLLRETDLPYETRGGRLLFNRAAVDVWASQRLLRLPEKPLDIYHGKTTRSTRPDLQTAALLPELLRPEYINLALTSRTAASAIRDVVAWADTTGRVLDPKELLTAVKEREELNSTALPGGFALLHARHLAPYRYEGSFLVLARAIQPVPFSAPDGRPTALFFLVCCENERLHLHTLARLCVLAMKTNVMAQLMDVADPVSAYEALVAAELSVLPEAQPTPAPKRR